MDAFYIILFGFYSTIFIVCSVIYCQIKYIGDDDNIRKITIEDIAIEDLDNIVKQNCKRFNALFKYYIKNGFNREKSMNLSLLFVKEDLIYVYKYHASIVSVVCNNIITKYQNKKYKKYKIKKKLKKRYLEKYSNNTSDNSDDSNDNSDDIASYEIFMDKKKYENYVNKMD